jgi:photosystem II stability/assembly factor-like uncharacterized protein
MPRKIVLALYVIIVSTVASAEWQPVTSAPSGYVNDILDTDNAVYLAHGSYGAVKSTDSMVTWQVINGGLDFFQARSGNQILASGQDLYLATDDGIYKSSDDGESWVRKSDGIAIGPGAWYAFTESIFEYNGVLFTGAWSGIYWSDDGAEHWQRTNISGQSSGCRFFVNHNGLLFGARENINTPDGYVSTDSGASWQELTTIRMPTITFLSEPPKLWAGTIDGVWLSTDNGATWEERNNGLNLDPYSSSIIRVGGKLITSLKFGGSGMFITSDEGFNWEDFGDGLPFLALISELITYGDQIVTATSDGVWTRDISEVMVDIETADTELPQAYELAQNYPNPFNPSTEIAFSIPENSRVTLTIYDMLGRQVETLLDETKPAGSYKVNFNANNLPSGMYFYKIQSGDYSQTKRMMLIK